MEDTMDKTCSRSPLLAGAALLLAALAPVALSAGAGRLQDEPPAVVVGSFDSRAVALAYMRSARFREEVTAAQAEMTRAVEAGDAAAQEAIGRRMSERQDRAHRQVFGNAPAPEVIALLADRLPELAERAGVDLIVSKWQLAYTRPGARLVDLTDQLAACFEPDAATLEIIEELKVTLPVPLEQLAAHDH